MMELLRATDPVLLSFSESVLTDAGIAHFVADTHASIVDGSISAIPRRLLVAPDDYERARRALTDAGLANELRAAR
jgi:hypothetical protein